MTLTSEGRRHCHDSNAKRDERNEKAKDLPSERAELPIWLEVRARFLGCVSKLKASLSKSRKFRFVI